MRYFLAIFIIILLVFIAQNVLTNPIPSPVPWTAPMLLCDSTGDNLNPSFTRDNGYFLYNFNILVWERSWGAYSQIFLKDFANPDSEVAVTPVVPGVLNQKPAASALWLYPEPTGILIIWQSNQDGNYDLFSALLQSGKLKAYRQITAHPADDINPAVVQNELVWERDSSIYFSRYSAADSTWSQEELLDSSGCSNPTFASDLVAYQKRIGNQFKIYERARFSSGTWNPPELKSPVGDNQFPTYSYGLPLSLMWQHRDSADWNLMNFPGWSLDPILFVFSSEDETHPAALDLPFISKTDIFAPLYFSFENSLSGDLEIYANDYIYEETSVRNISQFPGSDRHPALSEFSFVEADSLQARAWLAWERFSNGKWQIWGSYAETEIPGLAVGEASDNRVEYHLSQNFPNPFNPNTVIGYQLPTGGEVDLIIYNLLGQQVRKLVQERQAAGYYEAQWNGKDDFGKDVASGIYVYQLKVGNFIDSRKMLLIR